MSIGIAVIMFAFGLVLLVKGADWLVHGSGAIAEGAGISKLVVGLTVVAFGTSAPELAASIGASLKPDAGGLVVGAIVGSNIANIALILGASAILRPILCSRTVVLKEVPVMLVAMGIGTAFMLGDSITRIEGGILTALLLVYIWHQYQVSKSVPVFDPESTVGIVVPPKPTKVWWWKQCLLVLVGIIALTAGAELLVRGSITIAQAIGVPEFVIGLTLVAFGTSLPELATSIRAAISGQSELAVGNIIGSNVFNTLGVLGITSAIFGVQVPDGAMQRDVWVMLGVALLMWPMLRTGWKLGRIEGGILVLVYAAYIALLYFQGLATLP